MPCPQYVTLFKEFPLTACRLETTYFPDLKSSVTDAKGHNPAGYLVWQLHRAYSHAQALHGELRGSLAACDQHFSAEVRYHWEKQTVFRNTIPALGACWFNLVHERGERFRQCNIVRPGSISSMGEICNEIENAAASRQA